MHKHEVRSVQGLIEVECPQIIPPAREPRIHCMEPLDGLLSLLCEQILQAPGIPRLIDANVMPAR